MTRNCCRNGCPDDARDKFDCDDNNEFDDELDDGDEFDYGDRGEDDGDTVPCPFCGEEIHEDSDVCPKCGNFVDLAAVRTAQPQWVFWTAVILAGVFLTYTLRIIL